MRSGEAVIRDGDHADCGPFRSTDAGRMDRDAEKVDHVYHRERRVEAPRSAVYEQGDPFVAGSIEAHELQSHLTGETLIEIASKRHDSFREHGLAYAQLPVACVRTWLRLGFVRTVLWLDSGGRPPWRRRL
jgi:hypothetical protein